MANKKDHSLRHKRIYKFVVPLLKPIWRMLFNFEPVKALKLDQQYIVLSNHNMDMDPVSIAQSFSDRHMYFVASEHIFTKGFLSRLLIWAADPIPRLKGSTATATVM